MSACLCSYEKELARALGKQWQIQPAQKYVGIDPVFTYLDILVHELILPLRETLQISNKYQKIR